MRSRVVPVSTPLDLRRTLRPLGLAWSRFDEDGWWRAFRTPEGPATLNLSRRKDTIRGEAWGKGAGWVLHRIEDLAGLHDRAEEFRTDHPVVGGFLRRRPGMRFGRTGLVFEALLYAVIGQKVTGKEAAMGLRGLTRHYSVPAPGPAGLLLPPDPAQVAELPYHALHDLAIEKKRADTIIRLARRAHRLERSATDSTADAARLLGAFRGVGQWTIAETLVVSHGDPDAVSVGDYHLKHIVSWNLANEARGTDRRMLELLEPFRPHRGRVVRLLENDGRPYPRYGPRVAIRSIVDR